MNLVCKKMIGRKDNEGRKEKEKEEALGRIEEEVWREKKKKGEQKEKQKKN